MSVAWIDTGKPMFAVMWTKVNSDGYNYVRFLNSQGSITTCMKLDMTSDGQIEVYRRKPGVTKTGRAIDRLIGTNNWQLIWKGQSQDFPGMTKGYPKGYVGSATIKTKKKSVKAVNKLELLIL